MSRVTPIVTSALMLSAGAWLFPASASVVVVPDQFPTVQSAIDTGADTVQIRDGVYAETPTVWRSLTLLGVGGRRPVLDGLGFFNLVPYSGGKSWNVGRVDLLGRVELTMYGWPYPRFNGLTISECSLGAGLEQLLSSDLKDIEYLRIARSRIGGRCHARVLEEVLMEADTIDVGASWYCGETVKIVDSWFTGGAGAAIEVIEAHIGGRIAGNRIEGYDIGVHMSHGSADHYVEDNVIAHCGKGVYLDPGTTAGGIGVRGNLITDCGIGIETGADLAEIHENTILRAQGPGMVLEASYDPLTFSGNIVGGCGGPGVVVRQGFRDVILRHNTIFNNHGSGIVYEWGARGAAYNNIVAGNAEWGLVIPVQSIVELGCNDWFGNALSAVSGATPGATDLNVDPRFCNPDSGDVRLPSDSPLVDAPGCGTIGAMGAGCDVTATLFQVLRAELRGGSVAVFWRFGPVDAPEDSWLERASSDTGPWLRLDGRPAVEDGSLVQYDGTVIPSQTYWYRVGWSASSSTGHSTSMSVTVPGIAATFSVVPNPSRGPVSIRWTSATSGDVEVRVYDLTGREVAIPARGVFASGDHRIGWDGLQANGRHLPAGWYLLRLRGSGVDAARVLLLLQ